MKIQSSFKDSLRESVDFDKYEEIVVIPHNSIDILSDDGRPLFTIQLKEGGKLQIDSGMTCKHEDVVLDTGISITPVACNVIEVARKVYNK